jgi:hypothetical protein
MDNKSYSKGISWIDDCRIPFVDDTEIPKKSNDGFKNWASYYERDWKGNEDLIPNTQGRFPANLLVCDDMLNDGTTSKTNNGKRHNKTTQMFYGKGKHYYTGDKGTNSRYYDIDKWFNNIIDG